MKDSPFWTLIQAIVVGLVIPVGLAIYNQWQKHGEVARQEEKEAIDTDRLCYQWETFGDNVHASFALLFNTWREAKTPKDFKDLMIPMVQLDFMIKNRPKKREP